MTAFRDQYCFADGFGDFRVASPRMTSPGFFRFGDDTVCYGRLSAGIVRRRPEDDLYNVLRDITVAGSNTVLPFDADEVIENLRYERYIGCDTPRPGNIPWTLAKKVYYAFRPLMPVQFRKHLQRIYLKDWERIPFPAWPVDHTVENILERLLVLSLQSHHVQKIPFVWFWPEGRSACAIVTHDIETEAGRDFSLHLADLDKAFGVKSSFQIVPEKRYEIPFGFVDSLRARGCEVNLHGLNHDGQLFRDRKEFLRQVRRINQYAKAYGVAGFRSPVMYRNLAWYGDFDFAYDMSVPNVAHLDPQHGGCCTVMPYFVGNIVELPLTTTQDYSLLNILGERSITLWKQQIGLVTEKHGLISFNVHPDYVISDAYRALYRQLLAYLARFCDDHHVWLALPGEVDRWWRRRREMRVVKENGGFRVVGPSSEQAVVAYASLEAGRIVYEVTNQKREMVRSTA